MTEDETLQKQADLANAEAFYKYFKSTTPGSVDWLEAIDQCVSLLMAREIDRNS